MQDVFEIKVDMSVDCKECGEAGATQNGLCLRCISKAIEAKGLMTMTKVHTVFLLSDVHPKAKANDEGEIERTLVVKLQQTDSMDDEVHALVDMLGQRVTVTIALEQERIPGT